MDYNLLKRIQKPLGFFKPDEAALRSSYPSQDFINPGVGNVNLAYEIFVPIHCHQSQYCSTKANESDQVGFGSPSSAATSATSQAPPANSLPSAASSSASAAASSSSSPVDVRQNEVIPEEIRSMNERKRKSVGEDFYNEFMKTKIKTAKLKIKEEPAQSPKKSSTQHKFKLH